MSEENKAGTISYATLLMLKERGLTTHFLAFVAVFCEEEAGAQLMIDRYMTWAAVQPVVPLNRRRPTQKQWVEKFRENAPDFLKNEGGA